MISWKIRPKNTSVCLSGKEVRLKYAYYITCTEVIKDEEGKIIELICEYDPESRGGDTPDGRKVKGTIQWVDASTAKACEIRSIRPFIQNSRSRQSGRKAEISPTT